MENIEKQGSFEARALVFYLGFALITAVYAFLHFLFGVRTAGWGLLTVALVAVLIRQIGHRYLPEGLIGHLLLTLLFFAIVWSAWFTGGQLSSSSLWLAAVPIVATIVCGERAGIAWTVAVVATIVLSFFLHDSGVYIPGRLPAHQHLLTESVALSLMLAATLFLGLVYLRMKNSLLEKLKSAAAENTRARLAAEEAASTKGQFLANMSHEIRTPMTGLIGMSELMSEGSDLDKEQSYFVDTIKESARALLAIINDILTFSKAEAEKIELDPHDFDLHKKIFQLEQLLKSKIEEKQQNLIINIASDVPQHLYGDSHRLRQVLINLIGNAMKFTPVEGAIVLQVCLVDSDDRDLQVSFSVTDTGIGIPPSAQRSIFEAFSQASSSTARLFGGTGLGLSISRSLVQLMGGSLELNSREGAGSVFYFTLPFRQSRQDLISSSSGAFNVFEGGVAEIRSYFENQLKDLSAYRLAVVDDTDYLRDLLSHRLMRWGFSPRILSSGPEVVEELKSNPCDLLLMDMNMSPMSGEVLLGELKRLDDAGHLKAPKVICVTADVLKSNMDKCLALGADDYISKPIENSELARKIFNQLISLE